MMGKVKRKQYCCVLLLLSQDHPKQFSELVGVLVFSSSIFLQISNYPEKYFTYIFIWQYFCELVNQRTLLFSPDNIALNILICTRLVAPSRVPLPSLSENLPEWHTDTANYIYWYCIVYSVYQFNDQKMLTYTISPRDWR